MFFDPRFFLFVAPAILLMIWAQYRIKSAYSRGLKVPARLSGAAAARYILDQSGLQHVLIEETQGKLSDHYDPREKVLRLSRDVYHTRSAAAVGIAAHEAGHALQDAENYAPLIIRNAAVPAAQFGSGLFSIMLIVGIVLSYVAAKAGFMILILALLCLLLTVLFQIINLPVEFNASTRAKRVLNNYQIVDEEGAAVVDDVLNAAALTYVAATLQTLMTFAYYAMIIFGRRN
ncbi:zinc metallopeptidase [Planctomycetaceae bacterium]|nr:zinc metallopeptidase [Planctomycetaceae bacterium]